MDKLASPLEDWEYDELDGFLLSLEHDQAVQNLSEFDGFVTALISGPDLIVPSEWLPVVWGGAENAPRLDSPEAFAQLFELMVRHLNSTSATLLEDPRSFEPCFMENDVRGKTHKVVEDWCIGYMKAVMMNEERWRQNGEDLVELLSPIPLFASDAGWDLLDQLSDRHFEYLQNEISVTARTVHAYWLKLRGELPEATEYSVH
jgi:uncharacterized protein